MPNLKEEIKEEGNQEGVMPTEQEIERLRQELAAKEAELKRLKETRKEKVKAIFKGEKKEEGPKKIEREKEEIMAVKEKPTIAPPPSQPKKSAQIHDEAIVKDLQHVMSLPKPRQVKVLIYFAFKKGLNHAVNIAQKMKNPYILDEFHDTLVDELYDLLKKKKKI